MSEKKNPAKRRQPESTSGESVVTARPQRPPLYSGIDSPQPYPLLVTDPPRIGPFWLDGRMTARESGVVFFAHADDQPSVLLLSLGEGAAQDAAARQRLAGEVNKLHSETVVARGGDGQDSGRLAAKFISEKDDPVAAAATPIAPWVALAYDGRPHALAEADRLLRSIDLSATPSLGTEAGPGFRLHWLSDTATGHWRVWPLSWPGRHDRAGWLPFAVSWYLMVVLAALGVLIAVLLFQNTPPETAQPPVGTATASNPQSGEGTPETPQSPESGDSSASSSPSEASGSPSNSDSASPSSSGSDSASASPSGDGSESASATPSESGSGDPSSPGGHGSPSKEPSMGSSGTGTATQSAPPPTQNTRL